MKKAWKWLTKPSKPTAVGRWWKNVRAHTHTDDLAARLGAATGRTIARGVNLARARRGLPPIPIKGTWTNPRGKSGGGSGGGKPQGAGPVKVVPGKKLDDYKHTGFWPKWMVSSNKGILKGGGGGGSGGGYVPPPPHPKLPPEPPARKGDDWWGHRQQSLMGPGGKNVKTSTDVTPTKTGYTGPVGWGHDGSQWHWTGIDGSRRPVTDPEELQWLADNRPGVGATSGPNTTRQGQDMAAGTGDSGGVSFGGDGDHSGLMKQQDDINAKLSDGSEGLVKGLQDQVTQIREEWGPELEKQNATISDDWVPFCAGVAGMEADPEIFGNKV